jgi:hypothetical protein
VECRHGLPLVGVVWLLLLRLVLLVFLVLFFPPLVGVQQRLLVLLGL